MIINICTSSDDEEDEEEQVENQPAQTLAGKARPLLARWSGFHGRIAHAGTLRWCVRGGICRTSGPFDTVDSRSGRSDARADRVVIEGGLLLRATSRVGQPRPALTFQPNHSAADASLRLSSSWTISCVWTRDPNPGSFHISPALSTHLAHPTPSCLTLPSPPGATGALSSSRSRHCRRVTTGFAASRAAAVRRMFNWSTSLSSAGQQQSNRVASLIPNPMPSRCQVSPTHRHSHSPSDTVVYVRP